MPTKQEYTAKQVCDALYAEGGVVSRAAVRLDCTAQTVYNYAQRYVTVREAMQDARKETYANAQGRLLDMMEDPSHKDHKWAIEQILKVYGDKISDGLDWSDKQRVEHSGSVDIDWSSLTDEQVAALARGADPSEVVG